MVCGLEYGIIECSVRNYLEKKVEQMKVSEGVTEELKASDQVAWVRAMNSICNRAEEMVLKEIAFPVSAKSIMIDLE